MSRYRLLPTPAQEAVLRDHCGHARYVWNLAVEQHAHWHPGRDERAGLPGAVPAAHPGASRAPVAGRRLPDGPAAGTARLRPGDGGVLRPGATRRGGRRGARPGGTRDSGSSGRGRQWEVRRVSRKVGQVWVPKAGWVRFRWSRAVPPGAKSYRVTMDRAGRWHVAFAVIPEPVPAPGNGQVVGIDRGVAVSAALSTGDLLHCPGPDRAGADQAAAPAAQARPRGAGLEPPRPGQARDRPAAGPRDRPAQRLGREGLHGSRAAIRRDPGRGPADHEHDPVRQKHSGTHPGRNVRQKTGLNRGILGSGWGLLVRLLEEKAPGRVEKVKPHFTSQRCSACGQVDRDSRESQTVFRCTACGFAGHAE